MSLKLDDLELVIKTISERRNISEQEVLDTLVLTGQEVEDKLPGVFEAMLSQSQGVTPIYRMSVKETETGYIVTTKYLK